MPRHTPSRPVPGSLAAAALWVVTTGSVPTLAQPSAEGSGNVAGRAALYIDDDATSIVTALVDGTVALPADTNVGAHALVDITSSASVDVVSNASVDMVAGATPRFLEARVELGGRAGVFLTPELDIGGGFIWSTENDWESFTPSANLGLDLFKRNTRLTGAYAYGYNQVGRAHDPAFAERQHTHTAELGLTQLIDKKTLVGASYTFVGITGWQSSPYRWVRMATGSHSVLEQHPDHRLRHALSLRGLRYLDSDVALQASYRIYADDWGLGSNTIAAAVHWQTGELVDLSFRGRGYYQRAASFWREHYHQPEQYMSVDRELSTFWDIGTGVSAAWHFGDWTLDTSMDGFYYRYVDFALLDQRFALLTAVGLRFEW